MTLSGYQNPARGELRDTALALGGISVNVQCHIHVCLQHFVVASCVLYLASMLLWTLNHNQRHPPGWCTRVGSDATHTLQHHMATKHHHTHEKYVAAYRADFTSSVTHVCSAFENTPKTNQAREAR